MQPEALVFLSVMAVLLTVAIAVALSRGRTLDQLRETLEVQASEDIETVVRSTRDGVADARFRQRQGAEDLAQLTDQLEAGIVRLDDQLRVLSANRAARWLLGQSAGDLVGRSTMEVFVDHRVEDVAREAVAKGSANGEVTLHDVAVRTVVVRARRAATGGIWLVMEDMTELRRLQRIRTEFIDNLSHELRTPLTTIRLLTETVALDLEGAAVPPRIRDRILKIDVETGHLVQMVNELLDLSRIESGAPQLLLDEVEMAVVIAGAIDRLRPFADRQDVTLVAERPDGEALPRIRGDAERLGQLLINLLHNAVKFSSAGSKVIVRATVSETELRVSVIDEGAGIPRADLDRIFERFYKVDRARVRGVGGTGLGLAIARHIVEGHGGRIWAESEDGGGSTFTFVLPLAGQP